MSEITVLGLQLFEGEVEHVQLRRSGRRFEVSLLQPSAPTDATGEARLVPASDGAAVRIACLPAHAVISRCWSMPNADAQTLRRILANRLEADLPVPLGQLTWGFRRAPHTSADGTVGILVQAARSEQVHRYSRTFAAAGQTLHILTTEAEAVQALYRYGLHRPNAAATEALVLVTPQGWTAAFFDGGMIQSLRRVPTPPNRMDLAARECRQVIESQAAGRTLQRVWWFASPEYATARACLAEQLRLPVEPAEPAGHLLVSGVRIELEQLARYAQPIGLALAVLNEAEHLIRLAGRDSVTASPGRNRLDRILAQPKSWAVAAASLMLLAAVLHIGAIRSETCRMRTLLADADKAAVSRDFQPKLQAMQRLQTYRIDPEKIIAGVAQAVPDTIVVSSIQLSRDRRMVIKGSAKDPKGIYALAETLRKSSRFHDVKPERAEPAQGGAFTISMEVAGVNPINSAGPRGGK